MAAFGPFEAAPHLAIAVSGGSDSMALAALAAHWVDANGGWITALTVDHGLRPDSKAEAQCVGDWMRARGIAHDVLEWTGEKPTSDIQGAAREARYRLLDDWCRDRGVLHLLIGHTRDDQAETLLMRLQRGSGPDGLAGMSSRRELRHCRLLRPLLGVSRASLRDVLLDVGQPWLDDPSNRNLRFDRVRVREEMRRDWDAEALAESARRYGLARVVLERNTDRFLAESSRFHASGFCRIDRQCFADAPEDLALRALARVLAAVGGLAHRPPRVGVERLRSQILQGDGRSRTLGNCLVEARSSDVRLFRERRNLPASVPFRPGHALHWDRRFMISFGDRPEVSGRSLHLRAMTQDDWRDAVAERPDLRGGREGRGALPRAALWGVPAIGDDSGVLAVPHLNYTRGRGKFSGSLAEVRFQPLRPASIAGFCIA